MLAEVLSTFDATRQSVPQARSWARAQLERWDGGTWSADALLVLTELMGNAGRHGRGPVGVRLVLGRGSLRIEVTDRDGSRVALVQPTDPHAPSGRGLLLVEALSDRWGVEYLATGKVVWAEVATDDAVPPGVGPSGGHP